MTNNQSPTLTRGRWTWLEDKSVAEWVAGVGGMWSVADEWRCGMWLVNSNVGCGDVDLVNISNTPSFPPSLPPSAPSFFMHFPNSSL